MINFYSHRHSHFKTINSLSAVVIVDVVEVFVLIKSLHKHISPIPTYAVFTGEPLAWVIVGSSVILNT